ncbi:hypothetical protein P7K49_040268 [Saguinus oedipus]|uniref:Uncharacterized protein n=1 Tax=Saguinus oedipus TaxID=9490 RepID=A0ABQ9T8S9_SAGOE|nr:hypothetical protein P7K49_040268 [Saguinus oedipus]
MFCAPPPEKTEMKRETQALTQEAATPAIRWTGRQVPPQAAVCDLDRHVPPQAAVCDLDRHVPPQAAVCDLDRHVPPQAAVCDLERHVPPQAAVCDLDRHVPPQAAVCDLATWCGAGVQLPNWPVAPTRVHAAQRPAQTGSQWTLTWLATYHMMFATTSKGPFWPQCHVNAVFYQSGLSAIVASVPRECHVLSEWPQCHMNAMLYHTECPQCHTNAMFYHTEWPRCHVNAMFYHTEWPQCQRMPEEVE